MNGEKITLWKMLSEKKAQIIEHHRDMQGEIAQGYFRGEVGKKREDLGQDYFPRK